MISAFKVSAVDKISQAVAVILFLLYMLTVVYQLRAREGEELTQKPSAIRDPEQPGWSLRGAIAALMAATLAIAVLGEIISQFVEPFGRSLGVTYLFVGVVILPVAGAISEMRGVCSHGPP